MSSNSQNSDSGDAVQLFFIWAAVIYFTPFVALMLDEFIFKTGWYAQLPDPIQMALSTIYYPFIELVELLFLESQ